MKTELPLKMTNGEKYGPLMEMRSPDEAEDYLDDCVDHQRRMSRFDLTYACAREIERSNAAYYMGYYQEETRTRVGGFLKAWIATW